jgi:hypothetical protein
VTAAGRRAAATTKQPDAGALRAPQGACGAAQKCIVHSTELWHEANKKT